MLRMMFTAYNYAYTYYYRKVMARCAAAGV